MKWVNLTVTLAALIVIILVLILVVFLELPTVGVDNVDNFIPLTPLSNIDIELGNQTAYQPLQANNTLLDVLDTYDHKTNVQDSGHQSLFEKNENLQKKNRSLMKHNMKLQKQNEEIGKLNIIYQKRHLLCTCKNANPSPVEEQFVADPVAESPTSPAVPKPVPKTIDEISLTATQTALLSQHLSPKLKLGMLVGDLAVMLFPKSDLDLKTASALDSDKLLFIRN